MPDHRLRDGAELRLVIDRKLDRKDRDTLQRDAIPPLLTHLGEHRPGDRRLLAERVEMGADRAAAVGVSAAQREIHAGAHVVGVPVCLAVGRHRHAGARMGAVRIGVARPDMALVDVGVAVDEARQHDPAAKIDGRQSGVAGRTEAGPTAAMRPPSTMMSQAAKRSWAA